MPLQHLKGKKDKGENANNFKICNTFSVFKTNKEAFRKSYLNKMITRLIVTLSVETKIWLRLVNSELGFVKQTWKLLPIKLQND